MSIKTIFKKSWLWISMIRLIPHFILLKCHPKRDIIHLDIERWVECSNLKKAFSPVFGLIYNFAELMTYYPEFRNVFYYRLGWASRCLYPFCKLMDFFFISIVDEGIGPGLYIQHGWATSIAAQKIGSNCWIGQHVTIGYDSDYNKPTIGDNVIIYAGAKIFGKAVLGDNVVVGANAVVSKSVPDNCTVAGVPAYIVRKNGVKVKEPL